MASLAYPKPDILVAASKSLRDVSLPPSGFRDGQLPADSIYSAEPNGVEPSRRNPTRPKSSIGVKDGLSRSASSAECSQ